MSDELGALLGRLRRERGWSQSELAGLLADAAGSPTITRHEVSRHERGARTPVFWLPFYARVLDVPLQVLRRAIGPPDRLNGDPTGQALRVACQWLVSEPPAIAHLRAGRRIGAELISTLEQRTHELRLLDDHLGGADTLTVTERELFAAEALASEASYTEDTGCRLFGVIAELSQIAGWTASDAGEHVRAERLYLDGVKAAHRARDDYAAANSLSSLAYQVANLGRPSDAVLLAQAALSGARAASGRVRALLLERLAWAQARAGRASETDRALAEVDDAFQPSDDEPGWVYWLDRDEIAVMAGRCYVELHRPLRAVPLLTGAIERYPTDRPRETALYLSWLTESYVQANELDAARETHNRALRLAARVRSERLNARLREVTPAR